MDAWERVEVRGCWRHCRIGKRVDMLYPILGIMRERICRVTHITAMYILYVGLQRTHPLNYWVEIFCIRSVTRMIHNMCSSYTWKRVDSTVGALKTFYNCGSQGCLVSSWSRREHNAKLDRFSTKKELHLIITCPMAGTVFWFLCNLSKWIILGEQSVNVKQGDKLA